MPPSTRKIDPRIEVKRALLGLGLGLVLVPILVFAFGRMNPPTVGHGALVDKVRELAELNKAKHTIVLSHSQDPEKNPLTPEQKLKHAKRFFPKAKLEFQRSAKMMSRRHLEACKRLTLAGDPEAAWKECEAHADLACRLGFEPTEKASWTAMLAKRKPKPSWRCPEANASLFAKDPPPSSPGKPH